MACGCKDKQQSSSATMTGNFLCQRCLWFWVAVGVVAFLTLYHYHDGNGGVHIG
jgi:hypothetical protein